MPQNMDPVIRRKLEDFGRRWRALIFLRGICGGLVTLLGGMTVVSFIDLLFILPDGLRWGMSVVVYLATAAVVWQTSIRKLLRFPGAHELARLVEKAKPELREDLLSAVELGASPAEGSWDSAVFRAMVQADVSGRMRDLQMTRILPGSLIRLWSRTAGVALMVGAVLLVLPGLHYQRLMVRALAPMANIERVSRTKIFLVEPRATDRWQPQGDNLPILVQIAGPEPEKVVLETFPKGGESDRLAMASVGGRKFSATIALGAESLDFRVRAGDGITKRFTIQTRPRPHVVKFDKTFHFPAYSRLPDRHALEENGDLAELDGTVAEVKLQVNQGIKEGELEIESKGKTNHIALEPAGEHQMLARVPLTQAGVYRVHLIAAETGFENKFSPQYEIRPVPDLVPRVAIEQPKQDGIVAPEEVVLLQGVATDDVGLAKVTQIIIVNEEPYGQVTLWEEAANSKTNVTVSRRWDLLEMGVTPGDRVTTKLVAIDLKGNPGESGLLHLVISSPGFDTKRLRALEYKRLLRETLISAQNAGAELKKNLSSDTAQKVREGAELQRKQLLAGATMALEDLGRQLEKARDRTKETLKLTRPGRDAADLALVARVISVARQELVPQAHAAIDGLLQKTEDTPERLAVKAATDASSQVADLAARLETLFTDLLAADEADAVTENLAYLNQEEERMKREAETDAAHESKAWERLARRLGGVAKESQFTEDMLKTLHDHLAKGAADRAGKTLENLKGVRASLEKALINKPDQSLLTPAGELKRGVETAFNELRSTGRELSQRADRSRDELARMAGTSVAKVEQLRARVEDQANAERKVADARKKGVDDPRLTARVQLMKGVSDGQWKSTVEELKDRADLEEMRRDTDPGFVADVSKAGQALRQLETVAQGEGQAAAMGVTIRGVEKALGVLEAGHRLVDLHGAAKEMAQQERWEKHTPDARVSRPRDWTYAERSLDAAPFDLKKGGLSEKVAMMIRDAGKSAAAQDIAREMGERLASLKTLTAVPEKMETLDEAILAALKESEEALAQAREQLAGATPKLQDMMAGLGRGARELEKAAREMAADENRQPDLPKLAAKQQELNRQLEELTTELRRDANVQDMSTKEGRERARDADDVTAIVRDPAAKAVADEDHAMTAKDAPQKKDDLNDAAGQNKKIAETMEQGASHYANLEKGKADDTREALRAAEEDLGIKTGLDDQYALAEKLGEMANESPEDLLKKLEAELARNAVMRQELSLVAHEEVADSRQMLENGSETEKGVAKSLGDAAAAPDKIRALTDKARQLAAQAGNLAAADLPEAGRAVGTARAGDSATVDRAQQSVQTAADKAVGAAGKPTDAFVGELDKLAAALQQADKDLQKVAGQEADAVQKPRSDDQRQAAQAAQDKLSNAAGRAKGLGDQLQQTADELTAAAQTSLQQVAEQAARVQERIADRVDDAGRDIERAGRHEERLGTPQGAPLQAIGQQTQKVASGDVMQAQQALSGKPPSMNGQPATQQGQQAQPQAQQQPAQASPPQSAQQAVQQAGQALARQAAALDAAIAKSALPVPARTSANVPDQDPSKPAAADRAVAPSEEGDPGAPPTPTQSRLMARTLDQLDASMHAKESKGSSDQTSEDGKQGPPPSGAQKGEGKDGKDSQKAAKAAMKAAAQAQKSEMMAARAEGNVPGEKPDSEDPGDGQGAKLAGERLPPGALPQVKGLREGEWGKLPPKLAQGLIEAQREGISGDYRHQIETYFQVVAERAKDRKP